jgi:hypothetical protein
MNAENSKVLFTFLSGAKYLMSLGSNILWSCWKDFVSNTFKGLVPEP